MTADFWILLLNCLPWLENYRGTSLDVLSCVFLFFIIFFKIFFLILKFEVIELPLNKFIKNLNNYVSKKLKTFFFGAKKYLSNFYTH